MAKTKKKINFIDKEKQNKLRGNNSPNTLYPVSLVIIVFVSSLLSTCQVIKHSMGSACG